VLVLSLTFNKGKFDLKWWLTPLTNFQCFFRIRHCSKILKFWFVTSYKGSQSPLNFLIFKSSKKIVVNMDQNMCLSIKSSIWLVWKNISSIDGRNFDVSWKNQNLLCVFLCWHWLTPLCLKWKIFITIKKCHVYFKF